MRPEIVWIVLNSILTIIIVVYGIKKYISTKNSVAIWVSCGFGIVSFSYTGLIWKPMLTESIGFFLIYAMFILGYLLVAGGLSKVNKIE